MLKSQMKRPLIFILTGPSGSGKTTIRKELKRRFRNFFFSVSATSRRARKGERDGVDYFFLTKEEFRSWEKAKKFLETVRRYGNYYGTPKEPLLAALKEGRNCLLALEPSGVKRIKSLFPDNSITILIQPPSEREIIRRLLTRSPEERERRLREDRKLFSAFPCDYLVLNDNLKEAVEKISKIIKKELKLRDGAVIDWKTPPRMYSLIKERS
jgi:guanylate kinase